MNPRLKSNHKDTTEHKSGQVICDHAQIMGCSPKCPHAIPHDLFNRCSETECSAAIDPVKCIPWE